MKKQEYEEAITWNAYRAVQEAIEKSGEIPECDGHVYVSVQIRIHTDDWPGTYESGRHKSTLIGDASCVYRTRDTSGGGES